MNVPPAVRATLQVTLIAGCLAALVFAVFILYFQARTPYAGPGIYGHDDRAVAYSGSWKTADLTDVGGGIVSESTSAASKVTFTFAGPAVQWLTRQTPGAMSARVQIDGGSPVTVSLDHGTVVEDYVGYQATDLGAGNHTMTISPVTKDGGDGKSNKTVGIYVSGFRVPAATAPPVVTGLREQKSGRGITMSWDALPDYVAESYAVFAATGDGSFEQVGTTGQGDTEYLYARSATSAQTVSLYVVGTDYLGRTSRPSDTVTATVPASQVPDYESVSDCPNPTTTVSTSSALQRALGAAKPGTVIRIQPGTYNHVFTVKTAGTADKPIWICGSARVIINGGALTSGYGIHIDSSSYVVLTGMTVENALKGIVVDNSQHITVSDVTVHDIGQEGIHLRTNTTDSVVAGSSVSKTGLHTPIYGEGVYVGSYYGNWCVYTDCQPDQSDRNLIADNTIFATKAEAVDVKEGSTNGSIVWNTVNADDSTSTDRWIVIRSNGWFVADNAGSSDRGGSGIVVYSPPPSGYGKDNVITRNAADFSGKPGSYAVEVRNGNNTVSCDNTSDGQLEATTNVQCSP
ncbi:right-handed parallel beta-helix repeat-containing protein [Subtercola sp. YIM 133946]|uniref:right-handed parallel beta-helix repeat-containing protein n=1 Tax=Subtercola sp. YIM 133946 TaxID=3118909 RepID=UPI002F94AD69